MTKNRKYNGHPNWNLWNVSLWVNNDEQLYKLALFHIRRAPNRDTAALNMLDELLRSGVCDTPDGASYTKTSIRHAMRGL